MTLDETNLTEEQVMQVRDRTLEESYEIHDIGQQLLVARLQAHGFEVEMHGDDARHAEEVFYGDGPDLLVKNSDGEIVAYIEIKCKEKPPWFGRVNLRHYREYVNFEHETDVPVFLWFALVDSEDEDAYVRREAFVRVRDTDQIDGDVVDVGSETLVFNKDDLEDIDDQYTSIDGDDIVEVRSRDTIVEYIPNVHGNDVIELDADDFRSWPHFLSVVQ